ERTCLVSIPAVRVHIVVEDDVRDVEDNREDEIHLHQPAWQRQYLLTVNCALLRRGYTHRFHLSILWCTPCRRRPFGGLCHSNPTSVPEKARTAGNARSTRARDPRSQLDKQRRKHKAHKRFLQGGHLSAKTSSREEN